MERRTLDSCPLERIWAWAWAMAGAEGAERDLGGGVWAAGRGTGARPAPLNPRPLGISTSRGPVPTTAPPPESVQMPYHPERNMRLDIYVNYPGNCEEAFRFYQSHLGGTITGLERHDTQTNPRLPGDWNGKVLHARIEIAGAVLMGADIPGAEPMRSAYLTLGCDTEADAERIYGLLGAGGQIFMKMEKTPFANRFAMLRDRFGTSWMLLHQSE